MESFCRRVAKVELHAHLHGSVRVDTLAEVAARHGAPAHALRDLEQLRLAEERSLADCFRLFDIVHAVVTTPAALADVAWQVLRDFQADNVAYLELRSTPRATPHMSKGAYLDAWLDVVAAFEAEQQALLPERRMLVRCIVSLDRGASAAAALDSVRLALATPERRRLVRGVDLAGNPTLGEFAPFVPALREAREAGLGVTVHCGEIAKPNEVRDILAFRPDRLGHALCLPADQVPVHHDIVVEVCPTSNVKTLEAADILDHPRLGAWLEAGRPLCICTDDAGIFQTTLSRELWLVASAFKLSTQQVLDALLHALDAAFLDDAQRASLKDVVVASAHSARL